MERTKTYPRSKEFIINTLYDIIELQKGSLILSDFMRGIVYYKLSMYGYQWELMYTVTETARQGHASLSSSAKSGSPADQSSVTLRILGGRRENEKEMRRAFYLLESMLDIE